MDEELRRPTNVRDLVTMGHCKDEVRVQRLFASTTLIIRSLTHNNDKTDFETSMSSERYVELFDSFGNVHGKADETVGGEAS